jgi:TRAP-type C4-dicarboxylate transport system substrate-binding protein
MQNGTHITIRIHKHNNKNSYFTKLNKSIQTYNLIYNDKKWKKRTRKNVINEKAKEAAYFV